jgi:hypothetical protein
MQLGKIPLLDEGKEESAATFAIYFKHVTFVKSCEVRMPCPL